MRGCLTIETIEYQDLTTDEIISCKALGKMGSIIYEVVSTKKNSINKESKETRK